MFWAFVDVNGQPTYCPLAEFGTQSLREGRDIYARAVVALPVTAHTPLRNAEDVEGKIAILERGMCDFVTKVRHAQDAGAVAVIVANAASEDPEAAFVMDAGSRRAEATAIHIPSIMLPRAKAVIVFERIREQYLERRDYSMTIRFLGAQSAAAVLEQIQSAGNQEQQQQREAKLAEQREQQQVQATKLLRSRLTLMGDVEASPTASPTPSTASSRSSSSNQNQREEPQDPPPGSSSSCASVVSEHLDLHAPPGLPSYSWQSTASSTCTSLDIRSNNQELRTLSHWCPMTTALLVLDVQNYFALHQNESCLHEHSFVNLEYYKRIKTVMVAHIQDVLLACRSCEGVEVIYSVVESATPDGRDRSHAHKNAGIHVTKGGFGAQILPKIAPTENDIVLPRTGIKYVLPRAACCCVLLNLLLLPPASSKPRTWTTCCAIWACSTSCSWASRTCAASSAVRAQLWTKVTRSRC